MRQIGGTALFDSREKRGIDLTDGSRVARAATSLESFAGLFVFIKRENARPCRSMKRIGRMNEQRLSARDIAHRYGIIDVSHWR